MHAAGYAPEISFRSFRASQIDVGHDGDEENVFCSFSGPLFESARGASSRNSR